MPRYRVLVEYQGTRYSGWQVQRNARTIQGAILDVLGALAPSGPVDVYGAGRTDAGVHATGQVAHIDFPLRWPAEDLLSQVNAALPADIRLVDAVRVPPRFHARHDAVARRYLYLVSRRQTPTVDPFVWRVPARLDTSRMARAAATLPGMHDFRGFTADDPSKVSTLVDVQEVAVLDVGDTIAIRLQASHFLWKMVRRLVGTLVEVGRGGLTETRFRGYLVDGTSSPPEMTAPASGLTLEAVYYPGETQPDLRTAPLPGRLVGAPPQRGRAERPPRRRRDRDDRL